MFPIRNGRPWVPGDRAKKKRNRKSRDDIADPVEKKEPHHIAVDDFQVVVAAHPQVVEHRQAVVALFLHLIFFRFQRKFIQTTIDRRTLALSKNILAKPGRWMLYWLAQAP